MLQLTDCSQEEEELLEERRESSGVVGEYRVKISAFDCKTETLICSNVIAFQKSSLKTTCNISAACKRYVSRITELFGPDQERRPL